MLRITKVGRYRLLKAFVGLAATPEKYFDAGAEFTVTAISEADSVVLVPEFGGWTYCEIPAEPISDHDLKSRVLQHCYTPGSYTQLDGYAYLAARHDTTQVGIFILGGIFTRDVFRAAVADAKAAGLKSSRMYVYASLCTYSGPAIQFVKLDDLGLLEQDGEASGGIQQ